MPNPSPAPPSEARELKKQREQALLPCPFCASRPKVDWMRHEIYISCSRPMCAAEDLCCPDEDAWNRRATFLEAAGPPPLKITKSLRALACHIRETYSADGKDAETCECAAEMIDRQYQIIDRIGEGMGRPLPASEGEREVADSAPAERTAAAGQVTEDHTAAKASLMVLCAIRDTQSWGVNMLKDIDFAIEANRAALQKLRGLP